MSALGVPAQVPTRERAPAKRKKPLSMAIGKGIWMKTIHERLLKNKRACIIFCMRSEAFKCTRFKSVTQEFCASQINGARMDDELRQWGDCDLPFAGAPSCKLELLVPKDAMLQDFAPLLTLSQVTAAEASHDAAGGALRRRVMTVLASSQAQLLESFFGDQDDLDGMFDLIDDVTRFKQHLQCLMDLTNVVEARLQATVDAAVARERTAD